MFLQPATFVSRDVPKQSYLCSRLGGSRIQLLASPLSIFSPSSRLQDVCAHGIYGPNRDSKRNPLKLDNPQPLHPDEGSSMACSMSMSCVGIVHWSLVLLPDTPHLLHSGVLRILELPRNLRRPLPNEKKLMSAFLERETDRVQDVGARGPARVTDKKLWEERKKVRAGGSVCHLTSNWVLIHGMRSSCDRLPYLEAWHSMCFRYLVTGSDRFTVSHGLRVVHKVVIRRKCNQIHLCIYLYIYKGHETCVSGAQHGHALIYF